MKNKLFLFALLSTIAVSAHEFWLQPGNYLLKKNETVTINFRVGENFEGENWTGNREKINFLQLLDGTKTKDLSELVSLNKGDSLTLQPSTEGSFLVIYNGHNSFIELDAQKFKEYAEEDGLTDALAYRKLHNETDSISRENYQRCAKTILQVGNIMDDHITLPTSLTLDIVPQIHPHKLKKGEMMEVKILFNREPFSNGLVNIWHRQDNKTNRARLKTDESGIVRFPRPSTGAVMVSAVKMIRVENNPKVQWQSYWSSLTWGY